MEEFKNSGIDSEGRTVLRIPQKDTAKYLAAPAMYKALKNAVIAMGSMYRLQEYTNAEIEECLLPFKQALQSAEQKG